MTSATATITSEHLEALKSEQHTLRPLRGPGNYHRPMSQQYLDSGLDPKATLRHDLCSTRFQDHKMKDGRTVKENLNPCHEYCLCNNCAMLRSEQCVNHYKPLAAMLGDEFTVIESDLDKFPEVRALIKTLNTLLLGNVVWSKEKKSFVRRAMLLKPCRALPYIVVQAIRKADPSTEIQAFGASRLVEALRFIFTKDLPPDHRNRIKLKQMDRKVIFTGASQATRKKLSDKDVKTLSDNISSEETFCHLKGCTAHTHAYFVGTPENEKTFYTRPPPLEQAA